MKSGKTLAFFLFLSGGIVIGSLVAVLTKDVSFLKWLAFGKDFGFSPTEIDLIVLKFTVGAMLNLNVSIILCTIASMFFYKKFA